MAEAERAQECSQRRWGHHPVPKHLGGAPGTQHAGVIDMGRSCHDGMHQGEDLSTRAGSADDPRHADGGVGDTADPQAR